MFISTANKQRIKMKNLVKSTVIIFLVFCALKTTNAQQEPQYTQYMFNMMSVNPAYTGTREALNALMLSRLQWVGLSGAPRSHTFALHSPIKDRRMGLGASVIADNIGPVTNTYFNLNYAHRVSITDNLTLSLGIKGGIYNYYVGLSSLSVNEVDNSFDQDYSRNLQPNFGTGMYLYTNKYYVGFSVPKLLKSELYDNTVTDVQSKLKLHYFVTSGYVFDVSNDFKFKPSFLAKMVEGAPPSLDVTAQAVFKDQIWLGTTYRVGDAISLLFEMQVTSQIIVGYSYDITISEMDHVTNGGHEILLSFDFAGFRKEKVKSPRYF
jgi:type IX secretion system PorP/SprF family membrane protein